jgi:ABC-type Mn2+/Zn2+ transport system permease subunit
MLGVLISFACNIPTGASIVAVNLAAFLVFCLISFFRRKRIYRFHP